MRKLIYITFSAVVAFGALAGAPHASARDDFLYVSNELDNTVTAIDPVSGGIAATIPVGNLPSGMASNGQYVYVANANDPSVTVIDPSTNTVIATIPISGFALTIAISPDGSRLYADSTNSVSVIDTATNAVIATIPGFDLAQGLAVSPDGGLLYVANTTTSNFGNGWVSVVNTSNYSIIATIPVANQPVGIALTPDGTKAYVTNQGGINLGDTVSVIDTSTDTVVKTIVVGTNPFGITMNPTGTEVYVANSDFWNGGNTESVAGSISVIDTSTDTVTATIPVGYVPTFMTFSPDGRKLYVTNQNSNDLSVIDAATNTIIGTISTGHLPYGVTFASSSASRAAQSISFTGPESGTYRGQATLTATGGGSGNPVMFSVDPSTTSGACAVSGTNGTTVSYTGTGSCVIDANQAGGGGYAAAAQVQQVITVSPAPLTITASSPTMTEGGTVPAITATYSGFASGDGPGSLTTPPACSTTATSTSPVGTYPATCSGAADPDYAISYLPGTVTVVPPPCPAGTTANLRWHYSANGSAGGWSGTKTATCPGSLTMGPQAMEGNLKVTPGTTIEAGYDLTIPGNNGTRTLTVTDPEVTFTVRCVSGATPSAPTFTVTMPATTYTITGSAWYPSGDQSSPLVYQGSYTVPDLCAGGQIRLDKGGAFTATLG